MAAARVTGAESSAQDVVEEPESPLYLIDKSAWEQRQHSVTAGQRINHLVIEGRAATCWLAALEHLYSARNSADLSDRRDSLDLLVWLPVTAAVESTAFDVMARLARKGQHRLPLPDITIAATALVHGAIVMHYDSDFERIAEATGQRHEWIVPRGTGHGRRTEDTGRPPG
ncbi:MAG: PIN domain-containing protein [Luteitalea sp.]|nr:PIN domain-containing protein [Luteitalea sp.]